MSRAFKIIAVIFFALAAFMGIGLVNMTWSWYALVSLGLFFFALAEVV